MATLLYIVNQKDLLFAGGLLRFKFRTVKNHTPANRGVVLKNIKKKLLMDKDVIGAYVSEFNKLPTNEQIYAINKYKYLLDEYTLKDLSEAARNAYFKSLPRKLRNDYLIGKVSQRHIEAIIKNGYSTIIYDPKNKIGDVTFLDYAMDKLEYTDYLDELVNNINRPLTDEERETLNYIINQ